MEEKIWLIIGFIAQGLFSARFLVQWIASERAKKSVMPIYFWYFSLGGGILLLAYSIYRRDPVFILGQASGLFIYSRNLYLIYREKKRLALQRVHKS
ncbi:MAG: lipid-A-disaccharide synthase N-terminal domain-containing protein [Desulfonauticus sp.]|nr:lipid-A-disaccharide synthase N-terminal domain-containing protein [Desulfonauticus sp.]